MGEQVRVKRKGSEKLGEAQEIIFALLLGGRWKGRANEAEEQMVQQQQQQQHGFTCREGGQNKINPS